MANTISWVEWEVKTALEQFKNLDCEAGLREAKRVLTKFTTLTFDKEVAKTLKLNAEDEKQDPTAYYERTGLF